MNAHVQSTQAGMLTGRHLILLGTIAAHVVVIAALMTYRIAFDDPPVTSMRWVETEQIQREPEPPPPAIKPDVPAPHYSRVPDIPAPEFVLPPPMEELTALRPAVHETLGETVGPAAETRAPRVTTALQFRAIRPADDYYPAHSIRMQEQGAAIVRVCVGSDGRMDGRPTIERTSGSRALDAAALSWAREALVFTPATEAGMPVAACKGFRVNFTLR